MLPTAQCEVLDPNAASSLVAPGGTFNPLQQPKVVAWGDPNLAGASGVPDLLAGGFWTSANLPAVVTAGYQRVLSFNGTGHFIRKDTSALPSSDGAGFAAWCKLPASGGTELLFDAGSGALRVFRGSTTTTVRAVGTFGGDATSLNFTFPNAALEGGWHFLYAGIRGAASVCLVDGEPPAGLATGGGTGEGVFPDALGAFSANTTIGADTAGFNHAAMQLAQYYGLAGAPLTADEELQLRSFRTMLGVL